MPVKLLDWKQGNSGLSLPLAKELIRIMWWNAAWIPSREGLNSIVPRDSAVQRVWSKGRE